MKHYRGIGVSLEACSLCPVDGQGRFMREGRAAGEPQAILLRLAAARSVPERVGLEAGPLSPLGRRLPAAPAATDRARCARWLHAGPGKAGLAVTLPETRHVKAALPAPRQPPRRLAPARDG